MPLSTHSSSSSSRSRPHSTASQQFVHVAPLPQPPPLAHQPPQQQQHEQEKKHQWERPVLLLQQQQQQQHRSAPPQPDSPAPSWEDLASREDAEGEGDEAAPLDAADGGGDEEPPTSEAVSRELFTQLATVFTLYEEDRLCEANAGLLALEARVDQLDRTAHLSSAESAAALHQVLGKLRHALHSTGRAREIQDKTAAVAAVRARLAEDERHGWVEVRRSRGVRTSCRPDPRVHSIRVEGRVQVGLLQLLAMIHDDGLLPHMVPADMEARQLRRVSRLSQMLYVRARLPWPLDDRDAALAAHAVDVLPEGEVVVVGRSCGPPEASGWPDVALPEPPRGCRRLNISLFGATLRPAGPGATYVTAVMDFNTSLNSLPSGLLSLFSRQLAFQAFEKFRDSALQLSRGAYVQRMSDKYREALLDVEGRLAAYEAKVAAAAAAAARSPADSAAPTTTTTLTTFPEPGPGSAVGDDADDLPRPAMPEVVPRAPPAELPGTDLGGPELDWELGRPEAAEASGAADPVFSSAGAAAGAGADADAGGGVGGRPIVSLARHVPRGGPSDDDTATRLSHSESGADTDDLLTEWQEEPEKIRALDLDAGLEMVVPEDDEQEAHFFEPPNVMSYFANYREI